LVATSGPKTVGRDSIELSRPLADNNTGSVRHRSGAAPTRLDPHIFSKRTETADEMSPANPRSSNESFGSLSLTLPCYNEELNLERVVDNVFSVLDDLPLIIEVIVVDDGSSDGTGPLADRLAEARSELRVIHHSENRGYGAALRSGLLSARTDIVGYLDGDGQFDAGEIHKLLPHITDYDIVSGLRTTRRDPFGRRLISRMWAWLMRRMLGISVRDINSGFKLYRRRVFEGVELLSDGAFIDAEIFARAEKRGMSVKEVEIDHLPRQAGKQTGANPLVIMTAFRELLKLRSTL
jgi:glycosyltransferase involved in cell wall biosynthesis